MTTAIPAIQLNTVHQEKIHDTSMGMVMTSNHLAPLLEARVWLPAETPAGDTDVQIHRLMITGGGPATAEI